MNENLPPSENPLHQREQVVQAFQKFTDKGITRPDDLPLDDPEVIQANKLLDEWTNQQQILAKEKGTPEAELEFSLDRTTIYVDAGFKDPDYLDEVTNDWLDQDLEAAQEAGLIEIVGKIQDKINDIERIRSEAFGS